MGKTNRDKRRAKQKDRHGRRRTGSGDDAGSGAWSVFGQQPPRPSLEESAAGLISAAVSAGFAGDEEGIERCADQLAARAEVIGWRQAADRAMASALAGIIGGLWRGGWQPADIARWTTRERGPRHTRLAVDAIAAQLRIYPAVTVDEIFQTQLDALEARIWWNRDDDYLDAFAAQERIERPAAVRIMLQVICLVASAPALPMLCPPPGKARRGTPDPARQATSVADDKILLKVRALLAKAESTDFSEEAEAFTAGAQKLMARHSIDYALLAHQTGQHQAPVGPRLRHRPGLRRRPRRGRVAVHLAAGTGHERADAGRFPPRRLRAVPHPDVPPVVSVRLRPPHRRAAGHRHPRSRTGSRRHDRRPQPPTRPGRP